ncbi:MAG: hypothetical protein HOV79_16510 [Hamadaea sp.]|nr:hypothetical protein [Hamadaea sp.]
MRPQAPRRGDASPPRRSGLRLRRLRRHPIALVAGIVAIVLGLAAVGIAQAVGRPDGDGDPPGSAASAPGSGSGGLPGVTPSVSGAPTASPSRSMSATSVPQPSSSTRIAPAPGGPFPNASTTGVPAGTTLTTYSGSCTITTAGTVIDAKIVNCGTLVVKAANVTIKRSRINGRVDLDTDLSGSSKWHYTLVDSEVDAGVRQLPAVSYGNMTVLRSEIRGGQTSVQCGENAISCEVRDSWLHGQRIPDDTNWHLGGFLSNGGRNIRIIHNTIVCEPPANNRGEGCTGDLNLFGDFAVISDVVVNGNLLGANRSSSYCLYAGDAASKPYPRADHVVITNNVFARGTNGKCAAYGPVSGFNSNGVGNVWSNNKWDDGSAVPPEN